MSKVLEQAVTSPDDGETWDFQCPGIQGSPCGDLATGRPFHSSGWPTKKAAAARGRQHLDEHVLGARLARGEDPGDLRPMQELHEFRREQGLVVNDDGSVSVEDL